MPILNLDPEAARCSNQALDLMAQYRFAADGWPGWQPDQAARAALAQISDDSRLWALASENQWQWLAGWSRLDFDSKLFGCGMAKLIPLAHRIAWPQEKALNQGGEILAEVLAHAGGQGIECLSARTPARDFLAAQALEAAGFRAQDVSVEWMLDLGPLPEPGPLPADIVIRPWVPQDEAGLLTLAADAFCDLDSYADRFAMDPRLRSSCRQMYRLWLENSFNGDQADMVLVLDHHGSADGMITLRLPRETQGPGADCGWVVMNAIRPELRGRGLYNALLARGLGWLKENGPARARVRTKVSQQAVIRAWSKLGARQVYADMTFHLWLD